MHAAYLWTIPAEQGGQGSYRDFCSLLVNDINFLMDAAIEFLKEARKLEGQKEDQAAWDALTPEGRSEAQDNVDSSCKSGYGSDRAGYVALQFADERPHPQGPL